MLHCYFFIEYPVKQLEQLSTQQSMPTQDEKKTEQKESEEEGMESEDEEEAIEEEYEEYMILPMKWMMTLLQKMMKSL